MQSRATAQGEGDLMSGKGKTSAASGTFRDAALTWKARTEGAAAMTTPEELLAASHASCFSMALSHGLAKGGSSASRPICRAWCARTTGAFCVRATW